MTRVGANAWLTTYTYDTSGNTLQELDLANAPGDLCLGRREPHDRLQPDDRGSRSVASVYNGDSLRVARSGTEGNHNFVWDGQNIHEKVGIPEQLLRVRAAAVRQPGLFSRPGHRRHSALLLLRRAGLNSALTSQPAAPPTCTPTPTGASRKATASTPPSSLHVHRSPGLLLRRRDVAQGPHHHQLPLLRPQSLVPTQMGKMDKSRSIEEYDGMVECGRGLGYGTAGGDWGTVLRNLYKYVRNNRNKCQ